MDIIVILNQKEYEIRINEISSIKDFFLDSHSIKYKTDKDQDYEKVVSITYSISGSDEKNTVYFYE